MTNKFVMTNISAGSENLNRWYDFKAVAHAGGWPDPQTQHLM